MIPRCLVLAFVFAISVCSANTVQIIFTELPAVYENGSYNGFATATINGIPNQMLICDDSGHTTYVPSQALVYDFSNLVGPDPLQYARFVTPPSSPTQSDLQKYEAAAVLLYELTAAGPTASADLVTDYQYAIWNLFTPSTTLFRVNQTNLQQAAVNIAAGNSPPPAWLSTAYKELEIFTPAAGFTSNQEFLALDPTGVPEPAMGPLLALLAGCVVVAAKTRRRIE